MDELERMDESLVELLVKLRRLEVFVSDLAPAVTGDTLTRDMPGGTREHTLITIANHREQLLASSRAVCDRIGAFSDALGRRQR